MENLGSPNRMGDSNPTKLPRFTPRTIPRLLKIRPYILNFWGLGLRYLVNGRNRSGYDVKVGGARPQSLHCSDRAELAFVIYSAYFGVTLLPDSEVAPHVEHLLGRFRYIRERLESKFTTDQIRLYSTGGWPGFKEAALYALIRRVRPLEVIETGVGQGISSTFILDALHENGRGHLTSIDLPNFDPSGYRYGDGTVDRVFVPTELGAGWLVPEVLRSRWTLLIGPSQDVLPTLSIRPQVFLHDSMHTYEHMKMEFEWAWSRLPMGGLLVSDDISWNKAFPDFLVAHAPEAVPLCVEEVGVALRAVPPSEISV